MCIYKSIYLCEHMNTREVLCTCGSQKRALSSLKLKSQMLTGDSAWPLGTGV